VRAAAFEATRSPAGGTERCSRGDCTPRALRFDEIGQLEGIAERGIVPRGHTLFRTGAVFDAIYTIRSGSVKLEASYADGLGDVIGFRLPGETVGWDGLDGGVHRCEATTLEDTQVWHYHFVDLREATARSTGDLHHSLYRFLGRELALGYDRMRMLSGMGCEQRLAWFLVDLGRRYRACGYSATELLLRMSRKDIASYLGVRLETISRALARLHHANVIAVDGRKVRILAPDALGSLAEVTRSPLHEASVADARHRVKAGPRARTRTLRSRGDAVALAPRRVAAFPAAPRIHQ
jgi:CRP/FNR family transcriptional regulator